VRKDVERCFGVLQARFTIIRNLCKFWSMKVIANVMFMCIILHNMIVEDEEGIDGLEDILSNLQDVAPPLERGLTFDALVSATRDIENYDTLRTSG